LGVLAVSPLGEDRGVTSPPHPRFVAADDRETRQLYALQIEDPDGELFFLADGEADVVRAAVRAGDLVCPYPGCPQPLYVVRGGLRRRHHFAHRPGGAKHSPESWHHFSAKHLLGEWARRGGVPGAVRIAVDDETVGNGQLPDVLVELDDGGLVAIEVQYAALSAEEWLRRHNGYQSQEIVDLWILGHTGAQLRMRHDSSGDDRLTARVSNLHQTMLATGVMPYWIDPDNRTIATSWINVDGPDAASRFGKSKQWRSVPSMTTRSVQLTADALPDCVFNDGALRTPASQQVKISMQNRERLAAAIARERDHALTVGRVNSDEAMRARASKDRRAKDTSAWVATDAGLLTSGPVFELKQRHDGSLPKFVTERHQFDDAVYRQPQDWHADLAVRFLSELGAIVRVDVMVRRLHELSPASGAAGLANAIRAFMDILEGESFIRSLGADAYEVVREI
jgi:hypothetical protein